MELFVAQAINGCALGSLYALFGIGFGLVFATMGILNAAQGCYASFGAIGGLFAADQLNLPLPLAMLVGAGCAAATAVIVDQLGFQPLRRRGGGMLGALITSIAFWIILDSLAGVATGQQSLAYPSDSYPHTVLHIGFVQLPAMQLVTMCVSLAVAVGMHYLVSRTRLGAGMRAVGYSAAAAGLSGVNARMIAIITAALAGGVSGLAGVLGGISTANVSFTLGQGLMLKGFAAVVVGGHDDIRGTAIAGLGLGVLEVFCAQYLSSSFRDGFAYALLLGFLMVRPRGLFGRAGALRA